MSDVPCESCDHSLPPWNFWSKRCLRYQNLETRSRDLLPRWLLQPLDALQSAKGARGRVRNAQKGWRGSCNQLYCKCKCPRYSDLEGWFHGARQHRRLWVSLCDVIMSCYSWEWSVQGMMSFHAGWLLWPRSEEDGSSNENETQTGATPGTVALSWAKGHQLSEVTVGQTGDRELTSLEQIGSSPTIRIQRKQWWRWQKMTIQYYQILLRIHQNRHQFCTVLHGGSQLWCCGCWACCGACCGRRSQTRQERTRTNGWCGWYIMIHPACFLSAGENPVAQCQGAMKHDEALWCIQISIAQVMDCQRCQTTFLPLKVCI